MAVVGLKKNTSDKIFYDLGVIVNRKTVKINDYGSGKPDIIANLNNNTSLVCTFNQECIMVETDLVAQICEYMPRECGSEANNCSHSPRCMTAKVNINMDDSDPTFLLVLQP